MTERTRDVLWSNGARLKEVRWGRCRGLDTLEGPAFSVERAAHWFRLDHDEKVLDVGLSHTATQGRHLVASMN